MLGSSVPSPHPSPLLPSYLLNEFHAVASAAWIRCNVADIDNPINESQTIDSD
jgi:hypothetical protein